MRVLLIAPPGGGKGTQATRIAGRYGITHISSGDLFRRHVAERTSEGEALEGYVARGDLVPDDLALRMLREPIVAANEAGGFVLDGFPRTVAQARALFKLLGTALPPKYRPVPARSVARAMVDAARDNDRGIHVHESDAILRSPP